MEIYLFIEKNIYVLCFKRLHSYRQSHRITSLYHLHKDPAKGTKTINAVYIEMTNVLWNVESLFCKNRLKTVIFVLKGIFKYTRGSFLLPISSSHIFNCPVDADIK